MKRGGPLKRNAPIARGAPLDRGAPLARGGPIGRKPPRELDAERAACREQMAELAGFGALPEMGTDVGYVTTATRVLVRDRAGFLCEMTGVNLAGGGGQVHHRDSRAAGGSRIPELQLAGNLVLLSVEAHAWAESYRKAAEDLGFVVRTGVVLSRDVPVHCWDGVWLLRDDGSRVRVNIPPKKPHDVVDLPSIV